MYLHYELLLMSIFTVYEEEPHRLAGAVEGGEVGDVVGVGGDEHHVRGVRVAAGLEEGEVAAAAMNIRGSVTSTFIFLR